MAEHPSAAELAEALDETATLIRIEGDADPGLCELLDKASEALESREQLPQGVGVSEVVKVLQVCLERDLAGGPPPIGPLTDLLARLERWA